MVRLVGHCNKIYQGRFEVFFNGNRGTVCGDEWDLTDDANVVCCQLGFQRAKTAAKSAAFGGVKEKVMKN